MTTLRYVSKDVIKLRILRGGVYPGCSRWTLKAIISILIREVEEDTHTGDKVM